MAEAPILCRLHSQIELDSFGNSKKKTKVIIYIVKSCFSVMNISPAISYVHPESVLLKWGE